jgi:signal transduction histidine kinase
MEFVDLAALTIHDVKNRLAVLACRADAKGDAETLRVALETAATLSRLLAFYKAEQGNLGLDIDARVPADLLAELAAEISKQTGMALRIEAEAAPTLAFYDEALVRMILLGALYNALRYARQQIVLSACSRPGFLEFVVRDDGPGYPSALLAQPLAAQALSREGTGLGLHLASRVAAMHGHAGQFGCVELSNAGGAVFCLRLPQ